MTNGEEQFPQTAPESPPADQQTQTQEGATREGAEAQTQEGPELQAVTPGTAIVGTATIASLFTTLWANIVPGPAAGTVAYRWGDDRTIQAYYADGSLMTFTGEARPCQGTVILRS
jgi:hypothetical protein